MKFIDRIKQFFGNLFGGGIKKPKFPTTPAEVVGLGRDYTWNANPSTQEEFIKSLANNGANTTSIEFAGWAGDRTIPGQLFLYKHGADAIRPHYKKIVELCRKYGILLIVSVVNDNKGSGKYGDDRKGLDQYKTEVRKAMEIVLAEGPQNVWVQTVAETQTNYGEQVESEWIPKFKNAGFKVIYNNDSRPSRPGKGADFFAWHNCKLSDHGKPGCILVPDCWTAISAYTNGGGYGSTLLPDIIEKFAREVPKDRGVCIYTAWALQKVSSSDIKALSKGRSQAK